MPLFSSGQLSLIEINWTNGFESYHAKQVNDSIIQFEGGTLHEGGYGFSILIKKDGRLIIHEDAESQGATSFGEPGDNAEAKMIGSNKVLILKNKRNEIIGLLRATNADENLRDLITSIKVNHQLAGKYINTNTKKNIVFLADNQNASGITGVQDYKFEDSYDIPSEVITFSNKKSFYYEVTEYGLDLFNAKNTQYDDWEKGAKIMSLVKTGWLNSDSLKTISGKYPFASAVVLIDEILSCYSSQKLAIMRNEIFARHGLIFKSAQTNKYFTQQRWYKPAIENVDDKLSELERLNIRLIRRYEDIQKEDERRIKEAGN